MECLSRPAAKTVVRPINRPGYIQLMLRERWQSDIHWHMKHDIAHKVWGMSSVNGVLSVFRESCKHGKVLTTTGRFQSGQDALKGDGPIGAIATWFPGSTFWWMPYITHIYKITNTYTDTQWESCMWNLYADVHIKFSQKVLNQIWVIDFMSVCVCVLFYWLKKVCVQVLTSYLCAPDSLFVNCPKLTFTSITTNISLTHTERADPFPRCPHRSLSLSLCHWSLMRLAALDAQ